MDPTSSQPGVMILFVQKKEEEIIGETLSYVNLKGLYKILSSDISLKIKSIALEELIRIERELSNLMYFLYDDIKLWETNALYREFLMLVAERRGDIDLENPEDRKKIYKNPVIPGFNNNITFDEMSIRNNIENNLMVFIVLDAEGYYSGQVYAWINRVPEEQIHLLGTKLKFPTPDEVSDVLNVQAGNKGVIIRVVREGTKRHFS